MHWARKPKNNFAIYWRTRWWRNGMILRAEEWGFFNVLYCDFPIEDCMECLLKMSYDGSLPTLVRWEGATMFLPKPTIRSTLYMIARQGNSVSKNTSPWYITFDYADREWSSSQPWKLLWNPQKSLSTSTWRGRTWSTDRLRRYTYAEAHERREWARGNVFIHWR